jgi:hypothetical protein
VEETQSSGDETRTARLTVVAAVELSVIFERKAEWRVEQDTSKNYSPKVKESSKCDDIELFENSLPDSELVPGTRQTYTYS